MAAAVVALAMSPAAASATAGGTVTFDSGTLTATVQDGPQSLNLLMTTENCLIGGNPAVCDEHQTDPGALASGDAVCGDDGFGHVICPQANNYVINLGEGDNQLTFDGNHGFVYDDLTVTAGSGFDQIAGTSASDAGFTNHMVVDAGGGNDQIFGDSGNDVLHGGDGSDRILGEDGNDQIYGDAGDDGELDGQGGNDLVDGGPGNDAFIGIEDSTGANADPGDNTFVGGDGTDAVSFSGTGGVNVSLDGVANDGVSGQHDNVGSDIEVINGSDGPDTLSGNDGPNTIYGNAGADTILGNGGDDMLDGGGGRDNIDGGAGNDQVVGESDDDTLTGGPGLDSVFGDGRDCSGFSCEFGNDTILVTDGQPDQVNCGPGGDNVDADSIDTIATDPVNGCENVTRHAVPGGGGGGGGGGAIPTTAAISSVTAPKGGFSAAVKKGLTVVVACPSTCSIAATLTIAKSVAKHAHLKSTTVGSAKLSNQAAGSITLHVKLSKKARSKLKKLKKLKVTVHVTITTADNKRHKFTKSLTLRAK